MSWFKSTRRVQLSCTIPTDVSPDDVLDLLHDHQRHISLSPLVTDIKSIKLNSDPFLARESASNEASAYTVSERVPFWGTVTFNCSFVRHKDGVDSVANVPMGLKMFTRARVRQLENNPNWWLFEEDCVLKGYWWFMPFVVWNFEAAHVEMQQRLLRGLAGSGSKDE